MALFKKPNMHQYLERILKEKHLANSMNKKKVKQILSIILLILFVPYALYTLIKADFIWFLLGALLVFGIIKLSNKYLE